MERGIDVHRVVDCNDKCEESCEAVHRDTAKFLMADCKQGQKYHTATCCSIGALMHCEDFKERACQLEEMIRKHGDIFLLLPKFHCELAAVERVWCRAKWWCRRYCGYSIVQLRKNVPRALEAVGTDLIKKYWNSTFRVAELYRQGDNLATVQAKEKVRQKESKKQARASESARRQLEADRERQAGSHRLASLKLLNLVSEGPGETQQRCKKAKTNFKRVKDVNIQVKDRVVDLTGGSK